MIPVGSTNLSYDAAVMFTPLIHITICGAHHAGKHLTSEDQTVQSSIFGKCLLLGYQKVNVCRGAGTGNRGKGNTTEVKGACKFSNKIRRLVFTFGRFSRF